MKFLLSLSTFVAAVICSAALPGLISNSDLTETNLVSCKLVVATPGKEAYISTSYQGGSQLTVPIFIFRYVDIGKFKGVPPWAVYYAGAKAYYSTFIEDERFRFHPYRDDLEFINSAITPSEPEVTLNVTESGIYCVYGGPALLSEEVETPTFKVSISVRNSYGYLMYPVYLSYTLYKYFILIALALFGLLFHYILKFKVGDDFTDLNAVSIITKGTLFYILVPAIAFGFLSMVGSFLANNFKIFSEQNSIVLMVPQWLNVTFAIAIRFYTLLFTMGYGVIYCHELDSLKYRTIPQELWKRATTLFYIDFLVNTLFVLLNKFVPQLASEYESNSGVISSVTFILSSIVSVFPLVWFVFLLYHYFQTKKTISKFPVSSNVDENDKLLGAFRKSVLFIFVVPAVFGLLVGLLSAKKLVGNSIIPPQGALNLELEIFVTKLMETMMVNKGFTLGIIWASYISLFTTIVGIFVIWSKNNYGILVEKGQDTFNQVSYSDIDSVEP